MHEAATQPTTRGLIPFKADRLADVLQHGLGLDEMLDLCRQTNAAVAVILVLAGVVFLLWGFYAFKTLVIVNAAAIGGWLGYLVGQRSGAGVAAAAIGAFVAAAFAWPMMKYAVAVMGGLIGTVVGMTVWRTAGLEPDYAAAGGGMGLIFFGMLSFVLFRASVMTFTSLQGAAMLVFGILCMTYKLRLFDVKAMDTKLGLPPLAVPLAVAIAALIGMIYQNNDTSKPVETK